MKSVVRIGLIAAASLLLFLSASAVFANSCSDTMGSLEVMAQIEGSSPSNSWGSAGAYQWAPFCTSYGYYLTQAGIDIPWNMSSYSGGKVISYDFSVGQPGYWIESIATYSTCDGAQQGVNPGTKASLSGSCPYRPVGTESSLVSQLSTKLAMPFAVLLFGLALFGGRIGPKKGRGFGPDRPSRR